ncbi:phage tail tube protein [bacterium]|nr:phage tail tube protein [bacterium]
MKGGADGLVINGTRYQTDGEPMCRPSGDKRESMQSHSGHAGFTETSEGARLEIEMYVPDNVSPSTIYDVDGATIEVPFKNGQTFVLTDGSFSGERSFNPQTRKLSAVFEGPNGDFV